MVNSRKSTFQTGLAVLRPGGPRIFQVSTEVALHGDQSAPQSITYFLLRHRAPEQLALPHLLASRWSEQGNRYDATVLKPKKDFGIRSLQAEGAVCFFEIETLALQCVQSILLRGALRIRDSGSFCRLPR